MQNKLLIQLISALHSYNIINEIKSDDAEGTFGTLINTEYNLGTYFGTSPQKDANGFYTLTLQEYAYDRYTDGYNIIFETKFNESNVDQIVIDISKFFEAFKDFGQWHFQQFIDTQMIIENCKSINLGESDSWYR